MPNKGEVHVDAHYRKRAQEKEKKINNYSRFF